MKLDLITNLKTFLQVISYREFIYKSALIVAFSLGYVWFHSRIKSRIRIPEYSVLFMYISIVGMGFVGGMYIGFIIGVFLFGLSSNIESIVPLTILLSLFFSIYVVKVLIKTSFTIISDSLVLPLALAYPIGRIGCLINGCCYGSPTNLCIGYIPILLGTSQSFIHPTQLYYIISSFLILSILMIVEKRMSVRIPGFITLLSILLYSIFTFIIAFFRGDFFPVFTISSLKINPEHIVSISFMFFSIYFLLKRKRTLCLLRRTI